MRCTVCEQENREGRKFCAACGAPLTVACPTCGTARDAGDKFCGACGAPAGSPSQNHTQLAPLQPPVQYVTTSDGVRVAYATLGAGGGVPLVVLRPYFFSHVEAEWRLSPMPTVESQARRRMVVRLDFRGSGLSDRDVADRSVAARVIDLEAVVDRLGLDRFAIYAIASAGLATFAYAVRHPERISHLILMNAWVRGFGDWDTPRFKALGTLAEADWHLATEAIVRSVACDERPM